MWSYGLLCQHYRSNRNFQLNRPYTVNAASATRLGTSWRHVSHRTQTNISTCCQLVLTVGPYSLRPTDWYRVLNDMTAFSVCARRIRSKADNTDGVVHRSLTDGNRRPTREDGREQKETSLVTAGSISHAVNSVDEKFNTHATSSELQRLYEVNRTRSATSDRSCDTIYDTWSYELTPCSLSKAKGDVIEMYKYLKGIYKVDSSSMLPLAGLKTYETRGHCKTKLRANFCSFRIVNMWRNGLPDNVVTAYYLQLHYRGKIVCHWMNLLYSVFWVYLLMIWLNWSDLISPKANTVACFNLTVTWWWWNVRPVSEHKLFWQPSDCIINFVLLTLLLHVGNKYDDDDVMKSEMPCLNFPFYQLRHQHKILRALR